MTFSRCLCVFTVVLSLLACSTAPKGPGYDEAAKKKAVKVSQTARGAEIASDERILFNTGKSDIKQDGMVFIDRVATILKEKSKANVLIEGNTDSVGSAAANKVLSEKRATSVRQALIAKGVSASRIEAKGLGMSKPVADNGTSEGRQSNRRTDIVLLGESVENIGGSSLGDRLSEGLDRFLQNASEFVTNVFGSGSEKNQK